MEKNCFILNFKDKSNIVEVTQVNNRIICNNKKHTNLCYLKQNIIKINKKHIYIPK